MLLLLHPGLVVQMLQLARRPTVRPHAWCHRVAAHQALSSSDCTSGLGELLLLLLLRWNDRLLLAPW